MNKILKREAILLNFVKSEVELCRKEGKTFYSKEAAEKLNRLTDDLYDFEVYEVADTVYHNFNGLK